MAGDVPKFASFKAKKPAIDTTKKALTEQPLPEDRETYHASSGTKSRIIEGPKLHSNATDEQYTRISGHASREAQDKTQEYTIDRRGDRSNLQYESTDRYRIPRHRTLGRGQILGLDRRYRIDRQANSFLGLTLTTSRPQHAQALNDGISKKLARRDERTLRLIKHTQGDASHDYSPDYIPIGSGQKCRRLQSDSVHEHILAVGDPNGQQSLDVQEASDSDDGATAAASEIDARQKNAQLVQQTRDHPTDVSAWHALIEHQGTTIRPGATSAEFTAVERRTMADLRLSLYQKANTLVSDHERQHLTLGRLREGARIWHEEQTLREWQKALREHPTSHRLWLRYVDIFQHRQRDFRYSDVLTSFQDCLTRLQGIGTGLDESEAAERQGIALIQIHVIARMTTFMKQCGYTELSIAVWQAIFDLHVPHGSNARTGLSKDDLEHMSEFWDDEEARFGEDPEEISQPEQSLPAPPHSQNSLKAYARAEFDAAEIHGMPGKTAVEDAASDDPYHIVFFSDLQPIIETLHMAYPVDAIVDAWLCFHGMASISDGVSYLWRSDACLIDAMLDPTLDLEAVSGAHVKHFRVTPDLVFSNGVLLNDHARVMSPSLLKHIDLGLSQLRQARPEDSGLATYILAFQTHFFQKKAAKTAREFVKLDSQDLSLYNAAALVEAQSQRVDQAIQIWQTSVTMASRLSNRDKVLELIRSWAWFEACRGKLDQATEVLGKLSAMNPSAEDGTLGTQELGTTSRLRVLRELTVTLDRACFNADMHRAWLCSDLSALLTYVSERQDIAAACTVLKRHEDSCFKHTGLDPESRCRVRELIAQSRAELIDVHTTSNRPYRPRDLLSILEPTLKDFPDNTILLGSYYSLCQQSPLYDPRASIRSGLHSVVSETDETTSLSQWTFAITQTMTRFAKLKGLGAGPSPDGVRSKFHRALVGQDSSGGPMAHVPFLWELWFQFEKIVFEQRHADLVATMASSEGKTSSIEADEKPSKERKRTISHARKEVGKAAENWKQVLVQGVRLLPGSKSWILRGIEVFDRGDELAGFGLSRDELRRLYNVLVEREMRLRCEMNDDKTQ